MRRFGRILGRVLLAAVIVAAALLSPILWVETACRPEGTAAPHAPILPEASRRPEARTLLTYPEWHIVHAYEDYAAVIAARDPHDFGFLRAIRGFWASDCALTRAAGAHGGVDGDTKQTIYTIGVSFTAELLLKAAYEETLGRAAAWLRGPVRAPLDDLSAAQAARYAAFLQQVPWYRWDFGADRAALQAADTGTFRDRERDAALGLEYGAKALYARAIAGAVAGMAPDALTMRAVVTGLAPDALARVPGVRVVATRPEGVEIETPRYRAFTDLARDLAARGARFEEIAGNDDIMVSVVSQAPTFAGSIFDVARQGGGGYRHLVMVRVRDLAAFLRATPGVEHVHDY